MIGEEHASPKWIIVRAHQTDGTAHFKSSMSILDTSAVKIWQLVPVTSGSDLETAPNLHWSARRCQGALCKLLFHIHIILFPWFESSKPGSCFLILGNEYRELGGCPVLKMRIVMFSELFSYSACCRSQLNHAEISLLSYLKCSIGHVCVYNYMLVGLLLVCVFGIF